MRAEPVLVIIMSMTVLAGMTFMLVLPAFIKKDTKPDAEIEKPVDPDAWKKAYLGKLFRIGEQYGTITGIEAPVFGSDLKRAIVVLPNGTVVNVDWEAVRNQLTK